MRKTHPSFRHRELSFLLLVLLALLALSFLPVYRSLGAFLGFGGVDIEVVDTDIVEIPALPVDTTVTRDSLMQLGLTSRFTSAGELFELSTPYGRIRFDQPFSVQSLKTSYFREVEIRNNYIFIDTSSDKLAFFRTTPAEITLFDVPWFPGLSSFIKYSNTGQSLPCPECVLVRYDPQSVTFHVPSFSGYGVNNPSPPSQSEAFLNATTSFVTTHDDLFCHSVGTVDPDSDPVVMNYQFIRQAVNYTRVALTFDVNTSSTALGAVYDFSGNSYHGTLGNQFVVQTPAWVGMSEAKKGGAYRFDGVDDFIVFNPRIFNVMNAGFTVEAWVNMTSNYDYSVIFADGSYNTRGYSLGTNDGADRAFFAVKNAAGLFTVMYPSSSLSLHTYHHIAGVHDGTKQTLSLYIDGILVNQSTGPGPMIGSGSSLERPSVGVDWLRDVLNRQQPSFFTGIIDELLVFNRTLSAGEIAQHTQLRYDVIDSDETSIGQTWSCVATPTDGYYVGPSNRSNSVTIGTNQAPTHSPPLLYLTTGLNVTTDDAYCLVQNVADAEGYPVRNITSFLLTLNTTVLLLPLDNSDYVYLEDFSGYGNNGTVNGATFVPSGGIIGGAYSFDGVDDFLSVAHDPSLAMGNFTDFAIELWVKPALLEDMALLTKGDTFTQQGYGLFMNAAGNLVFRMRDPEGEFQLTSPSSLLTPLTYAHVAVSVDRDGTADLYVNGQLQARQLLVDTSGDRLGNLTSTLPLYLGHDTLPSYLPFSGVLDEVRIFSHTLTPLQVYSHFVGQYDFLDDSMIQKGHQLQCAVTPYDSFTRDTRLLSNTVTVLNSVPTHNNPTLSTPTGLGLDTENLTCSRQNTQDPDQDTVRSLTTFVLDNLPITVLSLPFESHTAVSALTHDHSGYGNNGTVNGATFVPSGGIIGGAYSFDGVDDFLLVPDHPSLDLLYDFTAELWVKFTSLSDHMPLVVKNSNLINVNLTNYGIRTGGSLTGTSSDELEFFFDTGGKNINTYTTSTSNLQAGVWYHVVVVKPYLATPQIYLNGALQQGSCTRGVCTRALEDSTAALRVGRAVAGTMTNFFSGVLDEVRIYDLPLTPAQILEHYALNYHRMVEDMTFTGDQWHCAVTPHDGEAYGLTKYSNILDIIDPSTAGSGGSGTGFGQPYQFIFDWYVDEEQSVSYTMNTLWEVRVHHLHPPTIYEITISSIDHQNGKTNLHIYPNIGALSLYDGNIAYVDLNEDGDDDISIEASDFSFQTATYTFSLVGEPLPDFTPTTVAPPPSPPVPPVQPDVQPEEAPAVLEEPAPLRFNFWKGRLGELSIPYRGIIVTLLVILILVVFAHLLKKVRNG